MKYSSPEWSERSEKSQVSDCEETLGKYFYSSSFKEVIRGVEKLIEDDDDPHIPNFQSDPSKILSKYQKQEMMTNGEKLTMLLKNQELRQKISDHMKQNSYLDIFPILRVDIQSSSGGITELPANEADLMEVFRRFDNLERVINRGYNTYVFFNDHISAYFAEKIINGLTFEHANIKIAVRWCQPDEYYDIAHFLNFERNLPMPELTRTNSGPPPKFTCRYKIQIENQKDFQVARRIIGPKGTNMKKIIDSCTIAGKSQPAVEADSIKLRLRGKGSGYLEGPSKTQSQDALHLCISCKEETAYLKACDEVEFLLTKIYEQYRTFCVKTKRKVVHFECVKMDTGINFSSTLAHPNAKNITTGASSTSQENFGSVSKPSFYNFQQFSGGQIILELSELEIRMYIEARNKARRELNFIEADRIRCFLKNKGVILIDEKGGRGRGSEVTSWKVIR